MYKGMKVFEVVNKPQYKKGKWDPNYQNKG